MLDMSRSRLEEMAVVRSGMVPSDRLCSTGGGSFVVWFGVIWFEVVWSVVECRIGLVCEVCIGVVSSCEFWFGVFRSDGASLGSEVVADGV